MEFTAVFWAPNHAVRIREFNACENWRDILEQICPEWACLAKIECEEFFAMLEVVNTQDFDSWVEITELE